MSDEHRVVASTRLIAALTLLSRVLGLVREGVFAHFFGTAELLSAFRIAFLIPNLSRRLFGEGALSASFIPVFTRALKRPETDRAPRLAGAVLTLLTLVLIGIVAIAEVGLLIADAARPSLTLNLTIVMLPFMIFICVTAYLGGLLNVLGRFAAPAAAPMMLNACIILVAVVGAMGLGFDDAALICGVCVAVVIAGALQVAMQWSSLRGSRFQLIWNRDWSMPELRDTVRLMGPMIVGLSAVQINTLLDMLIATEWFVPDGQGPAVLGYAQFLYQLPLGVFGIALATAIFPQFAARAGNNDDSAFTSAVLHGARMSFFIALPSAVGLMLIAHPLVAALLERGDFGPADTLRVSRTLFCYALGLCAYSLNHILIRAFYAMKQHGTPARIAARVVVVNLALNLILVHTMAEAGVALATAVTACLQTLWLVIALRKQLPNAEWRPTLVAGIKTVAATTSMALPVWIIVSDHLAVPTSDWPAWGQVLITVPAGAIAFTMAARLLKSDELKQLLARSSQG